jgi:hypothetical protein
MPPFLLAACLLAAAPLREIDVRLPCRDAVPGTLAVRVVLPAHGRYGQEAPVVVVVPGGWGGSSLSPLLAPVAEYGGIEVRFCFPGEGDGRARSGGRGDWRGPAATRALAAVLDFAAGRAPTEDGRTIGQIAAPLTPLTAQIGMLAFDNGGNSAVLVLAEQPDSTRGVAWVAMWETPVGDGMPTALPGARGEGPNPAWNAAAGSWDAATLAWDARLPGADGLPGAFYEDLDRDGRFSPGDRLLARLVTTDNGGQQHVVYPLCVVRAAEAGHVCGARWPAQVLDGDETATFWRERNAGRFEAGYDPFLQAAARHGDLAAMVLGSRRDHALAAPGHDHLLAAYDGWRRAGARFLRLNPGRAYIGAVAGEAAGATMVTTPGGVALSRATLPDRLPPPDVCPPGLMCAAGALELADRVHAGHYEPDLERPLFPWPPAAD